MFSFIIVVDMKSVDNQTNIQNLVNELGVVHFMEAVKKEEHRKRNEILPSKNVSFI